MFTGVPSVSYKVRQTTMFIGSPPLLDEVVNGKIRSVYRCPSSIIRNCQRQNIDVYKYSSDFNESWLQHTMFIGARPVLNKVINGNIMMLIPRCSFGI